MQTASQASASRPKVNFRGASGRLYTDFWVFDLETTFNPNQPAVYVVMRDEPQRYVVIYIGQTEDLAGRFEDHHKRQCMRRHSANRIAVKIVRDEADRLAIENDLITAYHPPCNG